MSNAREFLDQIADQLRAQGRQVEITESDESFGTFVWLSSLAPHWYDHTITLSAVYSTQTKRWALGTMRVSMHDRKDLIRHTRTEMQISAEVFGK